MRNADGKYAAVRIYGYRIGTVVLSTQSKGEAGRLDHGDHGHATVPRAGVLAQLATLGGPGDAVRRQQRKADAGRVGLGLAGLGRPRQRDVGVVVTGELAVRGNCAGPVAPLEPLGPVVGHRPERLDGP